MPRTSVTVLSGLLCACTAAGAVLHSIREDESSSQKPIEFLVIATMRPISDLANGVNGKDQFGKQLSSLCATTASIAVVVNTKSEADVVQQSGLCPRAKVRHLDT